MFSLDSTYSLDTERMVKAKRKEIPIEAWRYP